jgi:hypothetical protein
MCKKVFDQKIRKKTYRFKKYVQHAHAMYVCEFEKLAINATLRNTSEL